MKILTENFSFFLRTGKKYDKIVGAIYQNIRACLKNDNTPNKRLFFRITALIFFEMHPVFLQKISLFYEKNPHFLSCRYFSNKS